MICSVHVFININSLDNVLDSTVDCRLLGNTIGDIITNITDLAWYLIVILSNACNTSKNAVIVTDLPLVYGIYFLVILPFYIDIVL